MVSMGSSLKICLVAEGAADIYPRLGPTSEWDTAAAQCVVEQAGGTVTDTDMQPLRYNTKDSLLNPHFLVFGETDRGLWDGRPSLGGASWLESRRTPSSICWRCALTRHVAR